MVWRRSFLVQQKRNFNGRYLMNTESSSTDVTSVRFLGEKEVSERASTYIDQR